MELKINRFFRAYTGLKFKTVSIALLVSIAVIGACIIGESRVSSGKRPDRSPFWT